MIIKIYTPLKIEDRICRALREEVKTLLSERYGIEKRNISVEFPACREPERILIEVETRDLKLADAMKRDPIAEAIGKTVEFAFDMSVECKLEIVGHGMSSIYITITK